MVPRVGPRVGRRPEDKNNQVESRTKPVKQINVDDQCIPTRMVPPFSALQIINVDDQGIPIRMVPPFSALQMFPLTFVSKTKCETPPYQSEGLTERINEPPWGRCPQEAVDARWVAVVVCCLLLLSSPHRRVGTHLQQSSRYYRYAS